MEKSLTKNSIFYLIYNVLNVVFPFITGIYVARILLPGDIGLIETAKNLASYFVIFSFLGIPTYGLREISKVRNDRKKLDKLYSELMVINTLSTTVFLILYFIIIFSIQSYRSNLIVFLITGIAIALNFLNNSWLFEGLEKFDYISIRNFIFKFLSLLLLFLFVRTKDDYLNYAFITVLGTAGNYFLNVISSRKFVHFSLSGLNLKKHMKPIFYLVVVNLAIEIYSMVDITMLGLMCKKEVVTYYAYGIKIQKILLQIINTFTVVLVPRIALYYHEGKLKEFNLLLTKTLSIVLMLSLPIIVGISFIGTPFICKIYGDSYIRSAEVLKILSLAVCISPIGYLLGSRVMLVTGQENKMIFAVGTGAIVNVIGNGLMIPVLAENGAAIASILSEIVVAIVYIMLSHCYFNLDYKRLIKTVVKIFLSLLIMAIILFIFKFLNSNFFVYILQIPIAILVYFGGLLIMKEKIVYSYLKKMVGRLVKYEK